VLRVLVCGVVNVTDNDSEWKHFLCILGSPYILGGLEPAGNIYRIVS